MSCLNKQLIRRYYQKMIDREISLIKTFRQKELEKGLGNSNVYWLHAADEKIKLLQTLRDETW